MKLQLLRFQCDVDLAPGCVRTLQIEDHHVFARVVESLASEKGLEAVEPYALWDEAGKKVNPKKALLLLNSLPAVPYDDKALLAKLYAYMRMQLENAPDANEGVSQLAYGILDALEAKALELWGTYSFGEDWSVEAFLKAFAFTPAINGDAMLLDRAIALFGLCADIGFQSPMVMVNAKSFFDAKELETLFQQAVFFGVRLLLLESHKDEMHYDIEQKVIIDQDFLVVP